MFIQLVDHTSTGKYAHYGAFTIGSEMEGYSLKLLSSYDGDAGDSLSYHAGSRFSTKDMDQDSWDEGSCARSHREYFQRILMGFLVTTNYYFRN